MINKIQKYGEGLKVQESYEFLAGEQVEVDTISVDLSTAAGYISSNVSLNNIDTMSGMPGQILRINEAGFLEYVDPVVALLGDETLRKEYPGLQQVHDKVIEVIEEYKMVKKLVQDYD